MPTAKIYKCLIEMSLQFGGIEEPVLSKWCVWSEIIYYWDDITEQMTSISELQIWYNWTAAGLGT